MPHARKPFASRSSTGALVGALTAGSMLLAGCGGGSSSDAAGSSPAASTSTTAKAAAAGSGEKVTLKVGLFGTFGYKEAGLYDEYMKQHPNITIKEESIQQEQDYYQALQTHLAASSGLDDIQGIEVARIADVVTNQSDKFVDMNSMGTDLSSKFYDWKWKAATTKDGHTVGLGTDIGPMAVCYRSDLFKAAGLPTDPAAVAGLWPTWQAFVDTGKKYESAAGEGKAWTDTASGLYNADLGQYASQYYDASGTAIYETNPKVKEAWDLATSASAAGLTAKLKQFDPAWDKGFANGAFATIACPAWMLGYIKGKAGEAYAGKWAVAAAPGNGGNWGGAYLGIPTASKHQKEAFALAQWLTSKEAQVPMWTKEQHFPANKEAAADPAAASATDPYFGSSPIGTIFGDSASKLPVTVLGPKDGAIKDTFSNGLVALDQKGEDPDAAWKSTIKNIKSAIDG